MSFTLADFRLLLGPPRPKESITQIFNAQAAKHGGIVRRKVDHVSDVAELKAEVQRRGFHMVQSGDQYVILCNDGDFRMIC